MSCSNTVEVVHPYHVDDDHRWYDRPDYDHDRVDDDHR